jgi:hypothetical protein
MRFSGLEFHNLSHLPVEPSPWVRPVLLTFPESLR